MRKTVCALVLAAVMLLAGCDGKEYERAMELYNAGDLAGASAVFAALGDYEDSPQMVTKCAYGQAAALYRAGELEEAREAFAALGTYGDSAGMVTRCDYELAVEAFTAGDYDAAEAAFGALGDYEDTQAYLERIRQCREDARWLRLLEQAGEGLCAEDGEVRVFLETTEDPEELVLVAARRKDMGFFVDTDRCAITLTRGGDQARYVLENRTETYADGLTGYTQATASGTLALREADGDTVLERSGFSYVCRDIYGNESQSNSPRATDLVRAQGLYRMILEWMPGVLEQTGTGYTLKELGFTAAE